MIAPASYYRKAEIRPSRHASAVRSDSWIPPVQVCKRDLARQPLIPPVKVEHSPITSSMNLFVQVLGRRIHSKSGIGTSGICPGSLSQRSTRSSPRPPRSCINSSAMLLTASACVSHFAPRRQLGIHPAIRSLSFECEQQARPVRHIQLQQFALPRVEVYAPSPIDPDCIVSR